MACKICMGTGWEETKEGVKKCKCQMLLSKEVLKAMNIVLFQNKQVLHSH